MAERYYYAGSGKSAQLVAVPEDSADRWEAAIKAQGIAPRPAQKYYVDEQPVIVADDAVSKYTEYLKSVDRTLGLSGAAGAEQRMAEKYPEPPAAKMPFGEAVRRAIPFSGRAAAANPSSAGGLPPPSVPPEAARPPSATMDEDAMSLRALLGVDAPAPTPMDTGRFIGPIDALRALSRRGQQLPQAKNQTVREELDEAALVLGLKGPAQAAGVNAVESAAPAGAGYVAGVTAGARMPGPPLVKLGAGAVAGVGASLLTALGQRKAQEAVNPPDAMQEYDAMRAKQAVDNPVASRVGGLAPSLVGFGVKNPAQLVSEIRDLAKYAKGTPEAQKALAGIVNTVSGGAVGGGTEGARQIAEGDWDGQRMVLSVLENALISEPRFKTGTELAAARTLREHVAAQDKIQGEIATVPAEQPTPTPVPMPDRPVAVDSARMEPPAPPSPAAPEQRIATTTQEAQPAPSQPRTVAAGEDISELRRAYVQDQDRIAAPFEAKPDAANQELARLRKAEARRVAALPDAKFMDYIGDWRPAPAKPIQTPQEAEKLVEAVEAPPVEAKPVRAATERQMTHRERSSQLLGEFIKFAKGEPIPNNAPMFRTAPPQESAATPAPVAKAATGETPTAAPAPALAPDVPARIRMSGPQPYEVMRELPQTPTEKANGERYFEVRNERTGEVQTVEFKDMKPIRSKLAERGIAAIDRIEQEAKAQIAELRSGKTLGANKPIGLAANYLVVGAAKIAKGVVNFTDWSAQMVADFGEQIKPYLRQIYSRARDYSRESFANDAERLARANEFAKRLAVPDVEVPVGMHERRTVTRAAEGDRFAQEAAELREQGNTLAPNTPIGQMVKDATAAAERDPAAVLSEAQGEKDLVGRAAKYVGYLEAAAKENRTATQVFDEAAKDATLAGTMLRVWRELKTSTPDGRASLHVGIFERWAKEKGFTVPKYLRDELRKMFADAESKPEGQERLDAMQAAVDYAGGHVPLKLTDLWDAYRYTNVLSNPRTHERNVFSNLFQTMLTRPLSLAAQGDVRGIGRYLRAAGGQVGRAWDDARAVFAEYGKIASMDETGDANAFEKSYRARLPKTLTFIPRLLEAQDRFFGSIINAGEKARLVKAGLNPEHATKDANALTQRYLFRNKVGVDMWDQSQSVFSRGLDALGYLGEKTRQAPVIGKIAKPLIMFIRTPTQWAKFLADTSPLAYTSVYVGRKADGSLDVRHGMTREAIARSLHGKPFEKLDADTQRDVMVELKERRAMALAGTMATGVGAILAASGRTAWAPPKDEKERRDWYASGRKPYSVLIGDKWVPMWHFGPFALALAIPAAVRDSFYEDPTMANASNLRRIGDIAQGLSKFFMSQSPVSGIGNFFNVLNGDVDYNFWQSMGFTSTQVIPASGLIRYVNQWIDPNYRKAGNFIESIQRDTPFWSKELDAHKASDGTPATRKPMDILPPYPIGQNDPAKTKVWQQRRDSNARRDIAYAELDDILAAIEYGEAKPSAADAFINKQPAEMRSDLKARKTRFLNEAETK